MNVLNHSRRFVSVGLIAALAATVALGFASPAQAKHVKFSFGVQTCARPAVVYAPTCAPLVQCAPARAVSREYLRGVEAGRCAGFDEGFSDGLRGRCLDSCPEARPCCVSSQFLDGYLVGYADAYRAGFDKGQWERRVASQRHHHSHCRNW